MESNNNEKNIKSPLKQFKEGVEPSHIICREELELVFKSSDDDWKRLEKWHWGRANFP